MYCWIMNCWTFESCVMKKHNQFQGQWIKNENTHKASFISTDLEQVYVSWDIGLINLIYFLGIEL